MFAAVDLNGSDSENCHVKAKRRCPEKETGVSFVKMRAFSVYASIVMGFSRLSLIALSRFAPNAPSITL